MGSPRPGANRQSHPHQWTLLLGGGRLSPTSRDPWFQCSAISQQAPYLERELVVCRNFSKATQTNSNPTGIHSHGYHGWCSVDKTQVNKPDTFFVSYLPLAFGGVWVSPPKWVGEHPIQEGITLWKWKTQEDVAYTKTTTFYNVL